MKANMKNKMQRRGFLKIIVGGLTSLFLPISAWALSWNKPAFDATKLNIAKQALAVSNEILSTNIVIIAPTFAENGAVVQIEVKSNIANTEAIAILVEKNPTPLIANISFSQGVLPKIITRIKMAETSQLVVIVKAGEQYFKASREIEVNIGGCGS